MDLLLVEREGVIGKAGLGPRRGDDGPTGNAGSTFRYASQASLLRLIKLPHLRATEDQLGHVPGGDADAVLD